MRPILSTTMTVFSKFSNPFSDEDFRLLRVLKLIASVGREVLYWVFQLGCPKDPSITLRDYLMTHKSMTMSDYKKAFKDNMMKQKVLSDPSCITFDVPLLLVAIKFGCEKMAPWNSDLWLTEDNNRLEYLLKRLKDERNDLVHNFPLMTEIEMKQKIEEMRVLLCNILNKACDRFHVPDTTRSNRISDLNKIVDDIRDQALTKEQILTCKKLLLLEHGIETLGTEGAKELKLKQSKFLNPVSFVSGYDTSINIEEVFLGVKMELQDRIRKSTTIHYTQLLNIVEPPPSVKGSTQTGFISITGHSGSGKTMVLKKLMIEWFQHKTDVIDLLEYDLLLPVDCRDNQCQTLAELLNYLIPNTCAIIGEDVVTCARNMRLLITLDGCDEANFKSKMLVNELLQLCKFGGHTIISMSRSDTTRILNIPDVYKKFYLKMNSISASEAKIFVEKYHSQLVKMNKSHQSTKELVQFMSSVIQHKFFRIPINLVLLTYLWALAPEEVNPATTVTDLYHRVNQMLLQRVVKHVVIHDPHGNCDHVQVEALVHYFLRALYKEALASVWLDQTFLIPDSQNRLKSLFKNSKVFYQVTSSFLVPEIEWSTTDSTERLSFPSEGVRKFYAAHGLLLCIPDNNIPNLLNLANAACTCIEDRQCFITYSIMKNHPQGKAMDAKKLRKLLGHLVELLHIARYHIDEVVTRELIRLFQTSGVTSPEEWLIIMGKAKFPTDMIRRIAESFFKGKTKFSIRNNQLAGYHALMPFVNTRKVTLDIEGDPENLVHLIPVLDDISRKNCIVNIHIWQHYLEPTDKTTDYLLLHLFHHDSRCRVGSVRGHLSDNPPPELLCVRAKEVPSDNITRCQELKDCQLQTYSRYANSERPDALAETLKLRAKAVLSTHQEMRDSLSIQKVNLHRVQDRNGKLEVLSLGEKNKNSTKVFLLVGANGTSKTTVLDTIANYIFRVGFTDNFRLVLANQEGSLRLSAAGDQNIISVYALNHLPGMPFDFNCLLIDVPGFDDITEFQRDCETMTILENFLWQEYRLNQVDGVGFVSPDADIHLAWTQYVLSMFGKNIKGNLFVMNTYSDEANSPNLCSLFGGPTFAASEVFNQLTPDTLIKTAVKLAGTYIFNDRVLYACNTKKYCSDSEYSTFKQLWENSEVDIRDFFTKLVKASPVDLSQTKQVRCERSRLQNALTFLRDQFHGQFSSLAHINSERNKLHLLEVKLKAHTNYSEQTKFPKLEEVQLNDGLKILKCLNCNKICHDPCSVASDSEKLTCQMLKDGHCCVCPGKCHGNEHELSTSRCEVTWTTNTYEIKELKELYESFKNKTNDKKAYLDNLETDMNQRTRTIRKKMDEVENNVKHLEQIALVSYPVPSKEYIDLMIKHRKRYGIHSFKEDVDKLKILREEAALLEGVYYNYNTSNSEDLLLCFQDLMIT